MSFAVDGNKESRIFEYGKRSLSDVARGTEPIRYFGRGHELGAGFVTSGL